MEKKGQLAGCVTRERLHAQDENTGKVGLHNASLDAEGSSVCSHTCTYPQDDRFPCLSLSSRDPACQLLPDMPLLHTLMKMRRYERTFHTWPTAGTRLSVSMHVTLLLLARSLPCVSEWVVTLLAAGRENERPTLVSAGIQSRGKESSVSMF